MESIYKIVCKTHFHPGSGDSNFGVIDKLVQRDPTNELPCVYASSLKGAFREYWDESLNKKDDAKLIFGDEEKGSVIFQQAFLISLPARSNLFPFINITSPMAIDSIIELNEIFNTGINITELANFKELKQDKKIVIFENNSSELQIEDYEGNDIIYDSSFNVSPGLKEILGERIAIIDDISFKQLCSDYSLPVIARNNLENGQSNNLWYEQIIPRESRFIFAAISNIGKEDHAKLFFNEMINPKLIQIGANATIGYGQCLISKLVNYEKGK